jgi:multiple sugar transport system ATP-binding protein
MRGWAMPAITRSSAPIYTLELLGDATMVTVRSGGDLIAVRAPKEYRAEIGDPVSLSVPRGICHLFDGRTGTRIEVPTA